jgi:hypothetical protein
MRSWVGIPRIVVLAGGAGIVGIGCGRSVGAGPTDTGASPDVAISFGGAVGAGGLVGTGGVVGSGGLTAMGGTGGSAAGGTTATVDAGTAGTWSGGTGGSGGADARRSDAGVHDVPGMDDALGTGGAPRSGGATGSGGSTSNGGTTGSGGATGSGGSTSNGGTTGSGGGTGSGGSTGISSGTGPCDIYAAGSTPCVAAYSTVRALLGAYSGNLYQVKKVDGTTKDIGVLALGGFASSADQDAFCGADACTISIIYDQSGKGNHLTSAPASCYTGTASTPSNESDAKARSLAVGGHKVYGLYMIVKDGYRNNKTTGMPTGAQPQGIYEVVDGKRYSTTCCWDFGNGTTDNCYSGTGGSNALFFGTGYWGKGEGSGPWFMADFEAGVWAGGSGASTSANTDNPSVTSDYAMGILKTNATGYAIRVGNAQSGALVTAYDGALPLSTWTLEGGIVLGLSSDASNSSYGTFFEGAITSGRPTDATDAAVLQNVQAAGYGQ